MTKTRRKSPAPPSPPLAAGQPEETVPPIQAPPRRRTPAPDRKAPDHTEIHAPGLYEALAEFRYLIRRFLAFSEAAAKAEGLTPRHHQALLAIKGAPATPPDDAPSIGSLAERLCIRHHSAVELVDRLAEAGLVARVQDDADRRRIMLHLTPAAEHHLAALSATHAEELRRVGPVLRQILDRVGG